MGYLSLVTRWSCSSDSCLLAHTDPTLSATAPGSGQIWTVLIEATILEQRVQERKE